ncbi:MAG: hypothetical protein HYS07_07520 [Chlamydiae bacterium]|nr:hypothetical protein [Chlamydiota bacterium]MBI3277599.1 hypothetical protein [Chlamydiota bacterium]
MKITQRILVFVTAMIFLYDISASAITTNFTFKKKEIQSHINVANFGKLSEAVDYFLEASCGDKIDPASRQEFGVLFETEAVEMHLYGKIVFNELNLLKSREERLSVRYQLCKKIFISLWKKTHDNPRMRELFKILRASQNAKR